MSAKTQNEIILDVLSKGRGITALEAQIQFGIMRLAARILDLKSDGHKIISRRVSVQNRGVATVTVAKYWLV